MSAVDTETEDRWDLNEIVGALRASRDDSGSSWRPGRSQIERPSRSELMTIVNGLRAALFPAHFGPPHLSDVSIDYFVGHALETTLSSLAEQVRRALTVAGGPADGASLSPPRDAAIEIVRELAESLPEMHALLESDLRAAVEGDPAATSIDEVLFCYPGIIAIIHYRIAHVLYLLGVPLLARMISELAHADTGIDIHPASEIGERFFIDHGTGVVIGETARLGRNVRLYQGVTLGAKSFPLDDRGTAIKGLDRHPVVEDGVVIYAGATILGRVTIGAGSTIGGNVWLTRSVPAGSRVTQAQSRNEGFDGGAGI